MLYIPDYIEEKLAQAKALAAETGDNTLQNCLDRLDKYDHHARLGGDFAPHSFSFTVFYEDGSVSFNGGLLYHGSPDESNAVRIGSDYEGAWSIHT